MTRIAFVGAGSVEFTRDLLGDILSFPELADATIALHDIDPERLATGEAMARWTNQALGAHATIEAHLDRRAALEGCDHVINMIQVGGRAAPRARGARLPRHRAQSVARGAGGVAAHRDGGPSASAAVLGQPASFEF